MVQRTALWSSDRWCPRRKGELIVEDGIWRIAAGPTLFEIREGIHGGQVLVGIVGMKKIHEHIWSDPVNATSLVESSGEEGQVNISEATFRLVSSQLSGAGSGSGPATDNSERRTLPPFTFTPRGKVQAKGKGEMEMYFVEQA